MGPIALSSLLVAGVAGYAGLPAWVVPLAAAGPTVADWWDKLPVSGQQPHEPWSSKITTYFVTGVIRDLLFAALAFAAGSWARALTG